MSVEKRIAPRFDDHSVLTVRIGSAAEKNGQKRSRFAALWDSASQQSRPFEVRCFTRDVSEGGLSFAVHFRPTVGTKLDLSVISMAPKQSVRNLTGRVAWVKQIPGGLQHVVGVDLKGSDPESLKAWRDLVAERAAKQEA